MLELNRRNLFKLSATLAGTFMAGKTLSTTAMAAEANFTPSEKTPLLLNFNENSLGMAQSAKQAVLKSLDGAFRYPDAARAQLIEAIAKKFALKSSHVVLGNGSSEVIQAAVEAFSHKAQKAGQAVQLIVPDPTFNYAELYASAIGIEVVKVPLVKESLALDLVQMKSKAQAFKGLSIVYICNPNNPTATIADAKVLNDWFNQKSTHTVFIVDEAYAEFVMDKSFRSAVENVKAGSDHIVVTRTFSKIYAMAGLRIGYGLTDEKTAKLLNDFVSIDNTNTAGAVAALASLNDDLFFEKSLQSTNLARKIVTDALDELGLKYLPSQANFIFHEIKGEHQTYKDRMAKAHVFVGREFAPAVGYNRLTLSTPQEMRAFVKVLKSFRQKGWI